MEPIDQSELLQEILQNASKHIRSKEYQQAQALYQQGLSNSHPSNHRMQGILLSLRGFTKSSLGDDPAALADYQQALLKDPLHTATLVRRGVSFMKLRRYEQACDSFRKGMTLEPDNKTISGLMEELDTKIYQMKESEAKRKYPLKKKISEIIFNVEEEDEDLFLNFSNLKEIDKESVSNSKAVLFKYGKDVIQVEHPECPEDDPIKLPKYNKQDIIEIEKELDQQLQPKKLHQQLSVQLTQTPIIGSDKSSPRKSILRDSGNSLLPQPSPSSSFPDLPQLKPTRRISALSVKDIDGKIIKPQQFPKSDDQQKHINFGFVLDDVATPKLHSRMTKSMNYTRKSSMKMVGTILQRQSESIKFCRKDSSFSNKLNIDGKLLVRREEEGKEGTSRSSSASKSEKSVKSNKSNKSNKGSRQSSEVQPFSNGLSYVGARVAPKLMRKESILKKIGTPALKSKRSVVFYEDKEEEDKKEEEITAQKKKDQQ